MANYAISQSLRAQAHRWASRVNWSAWERTIRANGITIDRPIHSAHPVHTEIIYPINYGYIRGTLGSDRDEIDLFAGSTESGLVGAIWTADYRKQDRECKFIWNCDPSEIYLINGFINFDRELMEGVIVLRTPMSELWTGNMGGLQLSPTTMNDYVPIDCGFYDRLEDWAVRSATVTLELVDGTVQRARIVDFENDGRAEFARLASGARIRLDRLHRVNGILRPGASCSVDAATEASSRASQ